MSAATKHLVLTSSYDADAAPQPVCITGEGGTPIKQAAHVDGESGTVADLVDALVAAGLMADADES